MHYSVRLDRLSGAQTVTMHPSIGDTTDEGQATFAANVSSYSQYLLPMRFEVTSRSVRYYYDVTGLTSVAQFLKNRTMTVSFSSVATLIRGLLNSCEQHNANPEFIEWDHNYIYINEATGNWYFLFAPVFTKKPRKQCIDFLRFIAHSERILASSGYEESVRGYLRTLPTIGYTYDIQTVKQILGQISIPDTASTQTDNAQSSTTETNSANSSLDIPPDGATVLASSTTALPQFSAINYSADSLRNVNDISQQFAQEPQMVGVAVNETNHDDEKVDECLQNYTHIDDIRDNQVYESVEDNNSWGSLGTGTNALIVLTRLSDSKTYPVAAYEATIGRSSRSLIHVSGNSDISRIHVTVEISGDGFEITDMGSRNGTYVNDARIAPHHSVHATSPVKLRLAEEDFILEKR
ncbi:FHA domain-containing protein [Alloscardovia theropitheci]|uniref:FHA domain-containing protein n=1 Tax=Alloscardovia theropitheci TaxID=2496842 RepID=A0A4R0QTW9_9BIFI|nr:FHA domain-containing protein [Alloscardovia theropitheci]TCD54998.1 FHA domain-containing protein [Alloscardovia theropitheci]